MNRLTILAIIIISSVALVFFLIRPGVDREEVGNGNDNLRDDQTIAVPENWERYGSEMGISFYYPPDMEFGTSENRVQLVLIGPSQMEETEVYDGLILAFESLDSSSMMLSEFVGHQVSQKKVDPVYENISDVENITVSRYGGLTYIFEALGSFTYIYLPLIEDRILLITYLLEDPTNVGFENTLNIILDSLQVE